MKSNPPQESCGGRRCHILRKQLRGSFLDGKTRTEENKLHASYLEIEGCIRHANDCFFARCDGIDQGYGKAV